MRASWIGVATPSAALGGCEAAPALSNFNSNWAIWAFLCLAVIITWMIIYRVLDAELTDFFRTWDDHQEAHRD